MDGTEGREQETYEDRPNFWEQDFGMLGAFCLGSVNQLKLSQSTLKGQVLGFLMSTGSYLTTLDIEDGFQKSRPSVLA